MVAPHHSASSLDRRRGDYVACLIEFPWLAARQTYDSLRWMALAILLVAGLGLWFRTSHGLGIDPATLGIAVASTAFGLLRPAVLHEVVNSGAELAGKLAAFSIPAPSDRPAVRGVEIGVLAILTAVIATLVHAAQDRARTVVARVMAARATITETLHPRLAASLAAAFAAP